MLQVPPSVMTSTTNNYGGKPALLPTRVKPPKRKKKGTKNAA